MAGLCDDGTALLRSELWKVARPGTEWLDLGHSMSRPVNWQKLARQIKAIAAA